MFCCAGTGWSPAWWPGACGRVTVHVARVCVDLMRLGVWPLVRLFCLLRGCVALEYGVVSFGLHCFLRLAHAVYCRSRRCLASVAFSVEHMLWDTLTATDLYTCAHPPAHALATTALHVLRQTLYSRMPSVS